VKNETENKKNVWDGDKIERC